MCPRSGATPHRASVSIESISPMTATSTMGPLRPTRRILGFPWPASTTLAERNSLIAGGLGWMLDAMDVALYSLVLAHLMTALNMSKRTGGLLAGLTLAASAVGGTLFGFVADRMGR